MATLALWDQPCVPPPPAAVGTSLPRLATAACALEALHSKHLHIQCPGLPLPARLRLLISNQLIAR